MIQIRRLGPDDFEIYRTIRLTALRTLPEAFATTEATEARRTPAELQERLSTSIVLAADEDGRTVGLAGLRPNDGPKERHKAFVWGVFVDPSAQRRGIARALLGRLIEAAPEGVEQLTLSVLVTNQPAIALYESLGFVRWGLEPRAFRDGDRYSDELHMIRLPR